MHKLLAIAETLVLEKVLTSNFPVSHKSKAGLLLLLAAALLAVVGTGFLIVAFYAWVSTQFTPDLAALITAGAVFALSITCGLTALGIMHHRHAHAASLQGDLKQTIQSAIASFDDELGDHVRDNPLMAVLLAGLAGYVIANRAS